jgi:transcriptional regulator with XRE-family HTH domain
VDVHSVNEEMVMEPLWTDPRENDLIALFRSTLRTRMQDQGITRLQLAHRVGVSPSTISNLLGGGIDGHISTWSKIFNALDRDALEVHSSGSLAGTILTRPLSPSLVFGDYRHDLSYSMQDDGVEGNVRRFRLPLPHSQIEDLLHGRAYLQFDRILDRTAIAFSAIEDPAGRQEQEDAQPAAAEA